MTICTCATTLRARRASFGIMARAAVRGWSWSANTVTHAVTGARLAREVRNAG